MYKLEPPRDAQNGIIYLNLLQDDATFISRDVVHFENSSPSREKNSKNVWSNGLQHAGFVKKLTANLHRRSEEMSYYTVEIRR